MVLRSLIVKSNIVRKMSVFTQQLNPITGRLEWGIQPDDYDYKQEVARSAYADMLHDQERNDKYYEGLRRAVAQIRGRGDQVRVLDIGTGTGLLSMMAVSCGADIVTACEAFLPMAACARECLLTNGCERVKLVPKRSTEMQVGPGLDMDQKANLLVAELFDTELIGEGAIDTYLHARDYLLTDDALLVPSEGTVYAQVVSSKMLQRWNRISPVTLNRNGKQEVVLSVPDVVDKCVGSAAVHDLQLSQVPQHWLTPLSQPLPVLHFDWGGRKKDLPCQQSSSTSFRPLSSGDGDAVLMWWEVRMDQEGEVMLSCAPYWAHPDRKDKVVSEDGWEALPWRDHWMQAVYYLPQVLHINKDVPTILKSSHDEYSLWFNIQTDESQPVCTERPVCECGVHIINSRTRLGQLNDPRRLDVYTRVLERLVTEDSVVLALGDGCLMAIVAAKLGARQVYMMEGSDANRRVTQQFITTNNMQHKVTLLSQDATSTSVNTLVDKVNLVFSEPFFSTSLLPWHSLYCWYMRSSCQHLLSPSAVCLPSSVSIWGLAVDYKDLWKIRAPLGKCCGFNMEIFDKVIESASEECDDRVEPQPLWEYPARARSSPVHLLSLDLTTTTIPITPVKEHASLPLFSTPGMVNGMALWVEWKLTEQEGDVLSTGPVEPVKLDQYVKWDVYSRQGVYLFRQPQSVQPGATLDYALTFHPHDGTLNFDFKINEETRSERRVNEINKETRSERRANEMNKETKL